MTTPNLTPPTTCKAGEKMREALVAAQRELRHYHNIATSLPALGMTSLGKQIDAALGEPCSCGTEEFPFDVSDVRDSRGLLNLRPGQSLLYAIETLSAYDSRKNVWHPYATDPPKEEDGVEVKGWIGKVIWAEESTGLFVCGWDYRNPDLIRWCKILLPPTPEPVASRDWTEDSGHENGNYRNTCIICYMSFTGHKRRNVCKVCATPVDADEVDGIALQQALCHAMFNGPISERSFRIGWQAALDEEIRLTQQIADLTRDKERLDWLDQDRVAITRDNKGGIWVGNPKNDYQTGPTLREAIDKAVLIDAARRGE